MFLHSFHPHPLIATIGSFQLHWYGLLLAVATLVAISIIQWLGRKYKLDLNRLFDVSLITLVAGFIGARLYHVFNEWTYYHAHPIEIVKVWNGGLALHGGLLVGAVTLILLSRKWKWNPWLIADIFAPAMAIAQAIGRWGNYFNQELFGRPTKLPWGIFIDNANRPPMYLTQPFYHPTFLYEFFGLLIIAAILIWLHKQRFKKPEQLHNLRSTGKIALVYVTLYSLLRIATETLRVDRTPIIGGIRLPILVSGFVIVAAIITMIIRHRRTHVNSAHR